MLLSMCAMQFRRARFLSSDGTMIPGRRWSIRGCKHRIPGARVVVPTTMRFQVHRTKLPALGRIFYPREEALVLFLFRYFEPVLQKDDALADQKALEAGTVPEKLPVLFIGTKPITYSTARAVIPAPVEDDDFTSGGQLFNVALGMELRLLPLGWRGEGDHAKDARADTLHDALDHPAFTGSVSSFENDYNAGVGRFDPVLELDQLNL